MRAILVVPCCNRVNEGNNCGSIWCMRVNEGNTCGSMLHVLVIFVAPCCKSYKDDISCSMLQESQWKSRTRLGSRDRWTSKKPC